VEGIFDQEESQVVKIAEEYAMQHSSAIGLCLLARMQDLEHCVCRDCCDRLSQC
jgi:hypothetical protein